MSRLSSLSSALSVALIALLMTLPAGAEPPSRVGRVSLVDGIMTVKGTEDSSSESAPVNYPVSAGMRFATAAGSRGELELGNITARLDGRTELEIVALDDNAVALRLNAGSIDMRVRVLFEGESVSIDTRDGQIMLTEPGASRVDAAGFGSPTPAPVTHLAVFTGNARIHSPHGDDDVFAGEGVDINGAAATMRYGQADTTWLDDWAAAREQEVANVATDRYVDPETAGANALDQAGTWNDTPDYGPVWYPGDVPVDWAPYRFGSWAWVAPWGWTWIDDRPWGFAPFHYGRWVRVEGRWGWWPGERHRHPAYAPAVVGFDRDSEPSRHARPHGWTPLAPGEPYRPPYPHSDAYVGNINVGTIHVRAPNGTGDHRHGDGDHDNDRPGTFGSHGHGEGDHDHDHDRTGVPGFSGRGDVPTTAPSGAPPLPNGEGGRQHPIQFPGNHVTGDQIIINDDTFRRQPRPNTFGTPTQSTGPAPGITAMPLVTPPPASPTTPPAPITPMTTPPAGSYGQPAWRNDPRLGQDQQPRHEPSFQENPSRGFPPREMPRPSVPMAAPPTMPSSLPSAPSPSPMPQIQSPFVQPSQIQTPQEQQPRREPSFQENPSRGFAPREMPHPPVTRATPAPPPPQMGPQPSISVRGQPYVGAGNSGQGNTGQGNTGQNGR
ncbi:MAG: hypothetical protein EPO08_02515 [Rhodospirillaceae bacterium]|nr:MAG: hypothetical protein EPO08_02515 [Rhodospirillaceae bacterium]